MSYDIDQELCQLFLKASNGDSESQIRVGRCFEEGNGIEQSYTAAFFWYSIAAENQSAPAQFNIARLYEFGLGVDESPEIAARWYSGSAELGSMEAQLKMGQLCEQGIGVQKSPEEAFQWYRKAAESGNGEAQYNLASMYEWGNGVEQSVETAREWYKRSADSGNTHALLALRRLDRQSKPVKNESAPTPQKDIDPKELFESAVRCMNEGCGDPACNPVEMITESAKLGYAPAQYSLGLMYLTGDGVDLSYDKAFDWFSKAANQGDSNAMYQLGGLYEWGNGIPESVEKAIWYYSKAKELGNIRAAVSLNLIQASMKPADGSIDPKLRALMKEAERGDPGSQYELGVVFEQGVLAPKNDSEATHWYLLAAYNGSEEAKKRLKELDVPELDVQIDIPRDNKFGFDLGEVQMAIIEALRLREILLKGNEPSQNDDEEDDEPPADTHATETGKGWDAFIEALNTTQCDYLRSCLKRIDWDDGQYDRDLIEEDINDISRETLDDSVVESGIISEDYIDKLRMVLRYGR